MENLDTPKDVLLDMALEFVIENREAHLDGDTSRIYASIDFFGKNIREIIELTEDKKSLKKTLDAIRKGASKQIFNIFK